MLRPRPRLLPAILLVALVAPGAGAALLEDATGDVTARHFEQAHTPVPGWDAMDLVSLDVAELPDVLRFTVAASGLQGTADYDAGNYFVYIMRGTQHYTVRMIQDNQGTAVVTELLRTETRDVFGDVIAQLETRVDAAAGTITTDVPRDLLIDEDGAAPARGGSLHGIVVSAEAHATGLYTGGFMGLEGGPLIIGDRMPDQWTDGATPGPANLTFQYGGGERSGGLDLSVVRPYRASNGEATIYVYRVTAHNHGDTPRTLALTADGLPDGWDVRFPGDRLVLEASTNATFDAYLRVPFAHEHGSTQRADLVLAAPDDPEAWARTEIGVHYLSTPQPSGHHPLAYLHSAAVAGSNPLKSLFGGGDNALYWNTLENDERDQGLAMSGVASTSAFHWNGCLSPRLALGLTPDTVPGLAELTFQSQVALTGTLTGSISTVQAKRGAHCMDAHTWDAPRTQIIRLEPVTITLEGTQGIESILTPTHATPLPFEPGMDLLLELTFTPDLPLTNLDSIDLLPGGRLRMPLLDHHEAAPEALPGDNGTTVPAPEAFVEKAKPVEESPGVGVVGLLGVVAVAVAVAVERKNE